MSEPPKKAGENRVPSKLKGTENPPVTLAPVEAVPAATPLVTLAPVEPLQGKPPPKSSR